MVVFSTTQGRSKQLNSQAIKGTRQRKDDNLQVSKMIRFRVCKHKWLEDVFPVIQIVGAILLHIDGGFETNRSKITRILIASPTKPSDSGTIKEPIIT